MRRFLISLSFLWAVFSCQSGIQSILIQAESYLQQRPDSALFLLKSIDPNQLKTKTEKAQYALLMSAAMDKNYIDVTSDTLIRKAVEFYSKHGKPKDRMLAYYYNGIVLKNAKEFPAAIVAFEKAEKNAQMIDDSFYMGLISRNKAIIFSNTRNGEEAIRHHQKAVAAFDKIHATVYLSYAELALALEYFNNKQYKQTDSLLHLIKEKNTNPSILYRCNLYFGDVLIARDSLVETAIELYRQTPLKYYTPFDFANRALVFEKTGKKDSADFWLSYGYNRCHNHVDSASLDYARSQIAMNRGQYKEAFYLVKESMTVQDSLTRVLLQQSVSGAQRDYYKSEALRQEEQLRNAKREKVLGWVIVLLLVLAGSSWFIILFRKKDRQLQEQISRLALQEKEIFRTNKANAHLLGSLFSTRIEHLDQMTRAYFNADDRQEKERLFKQIKQNVASLRNTPEAFSSLEDDLNRYCNGIMSKLRMQVPGIKGNHLHIITLFFAGFPYEVVQLIMNSVSVESLKTARSRYRKAILAANAPDETFFLEMLEMKKRPQNNTNEVVEGC